MIPIPADEVSLPVRDTYFRFRLGLRKIKNTIRHDALPPIYEPIPVDPAAITYTISWNELRNRSSMDRPEFFNRRKPRIAGTVLTGDWDRDLKLFENCVVYRSFVSHFVENTPWPETELYQQAVERITEGEALWGCESESEFGERCEKLDHLFYDMKTNGYRSQRELRHQSDSFENVRDNPVNRTIENEILVHIGRDGKVIFFDGRNRLSISKILDLDSISVVVLVRHRRWQCLRNQVARGEMTESDLPTDPEHPDISNISTT